MLLVGKYLRIFPQHISNEGNLLMEAEKMERDVSFIGFCRIVLVFGSVDKCSCFGRF